MPDKIDCRIGAITHRSSSSHPHLSHHYLFETRRLQPFSLVPHPEHSLDSVLDIAEMSAVDSNGPHPSSPSSSPRTKPASAVSSRQPQRGILRQQSSDSLTSAAPSSTSSLPPLTLDPATATSAAAADSLPSPSAAAIAAAASPLPLHRQWTFHFSLPSENPQRGKWDETAITPVCDVATVQQFWYVFHTLARPTSLPLRADVHVFLRTVQPTWEEPANASGGRWLIEYKRGEEDALSAAWLSTLLAIVGEQFTDSEEVMGVVLSVRKGKNKLQLWTRNGSRREETIRLGREWKAAVDYNSKIGYMTHDDSKKYSAEMKSRFEV